MFNDYDGNVRDREVIIYAKDKLELVNDYTKNISQSIFSPGVLPSSKFLDKQYRAQGNLGRRAGNKLLPNKHLGRRTNSAKPGTISN